MDWTGIETRTYWLVFCVTFLVVGWWENRAPERDWLIPSGKRWRNHFVLFLVLPALRLVVHWSSPVVAALAVEASGWGLLPKLGVPYWVGFVVSVLALDGVKYAMHRLFHIVPFLWPVHRVHHSDPDFDVSTSVRFHPVETILMQASGYGVIFALGTPVAAVLTAGLVGNFVNVFQHANAKLPERWEERIRPLLMTARVHRIHHSDAWSDEHTNFGEVYPWWDRMLGTYRWIPERGAEMQVGLPGYQDEKSMGLVEMLTQPLKADRAKTS